MINRIMKSLLSLIMTLGVFAPVSHVTAAVKTGVVDINRGSLTVRSGPGTNYKTIGTIKNCAQVPVYYIKSGWAQIKYGKKKGYVSDDYLRFYSAIPEVTAKVLVDSADQTERITWNNNYTKSQIYVIMAPKFTKSYIDRYFKQQFRMAGIGSNGNQLYHINETEIFGLALYPLDWKPDYEPNKPIITHFVKNGIEYLYVSQYHINQESGNKTTTICFIKSGSKWLVFDHLVK